ncbi:MAG: hypothetical protein U9N87_02530 [Planctomycetota bacterium]|nr:hypothetical protein [Planctomycetota bacterium]
MCVNRYFRLLYLTSILCAGLVAIVTTGCGRGTSPVMGKVVFADNQEAVTGLAEFVITMESAEQKLSATGIIQPDGTFLVSTFEEGDGAMPGTYRVVITPPIASLTSEGPMPKPIIDPRYGRLQTSTLNVTVEPGENEFLVEVERAQP